QARALGAEAWFWLGDLDLGLHMARTEMLRAGMPLSAVTARLAGATGLRAALLPSTDDRLRTMITIPDGEVDFQTYYVRRAHADPVSAIRFDGAETARPAPGVLEAIGVADVVVIAPSNPFISIHPILAVPGIRDAVAARRDRVVAVSPIVAGRALRGPAAGMLETLGHETAVVGVIAAGTDLVELVLAAAPPLRDGDVVVVAHKAVSKSEGRVVDLATVTTSARALELSREGGDPRM